MRRVLVPLALVVSLTTGLTVLTTLRGSAREPARVRHYYVQAENVDWVLVPTGYYDEEEYEALKKEAEVPPASPTAQPPPAPLPGAVALPPSAAQEPDGTALVDRLRDE